MKNIQIRAGKSWLLFIIISVISCKSEKINTNQVKTDSLLIIKDTTVIPVVPAAASEIKNMTICEFISYNDDGDYFVIYVKENNKEKVFINDKIETRATCCVAI